MTFSIGVGTGGPAAYWYSHAISKSNCRSAYVITFFFVLITAAVLAETCSALPAAGSIYLYSPSFEWADKQLGGRGRRS